MNLPRGLSSRAKKGCKGQSQGCSAFRSLALLSMADICILQIIVFVYLYIQISLHFCVNIFWICICFKVKVALHAVVGGWCFCLNNEILVCLYFHFFCGSFVLYFCQSQGCTVFPVADIFVQIIISVTVHKEVLGRGAKRVQLKQCHTSC